MLGGASGFWAADFSDAHTSASGLRGRYGLWAGLPGGVWHHLRREGLVRVVVVVKRQSDLLQPIFAFCPTGGLNIRLRALKVARAKT